MSQAFSENSKVLFPFLKVLNFVQASTLRSSTNLKVKFIFYCYTISVVSVLTWFMVSNSFNRIQTSLSPLTFQAQTIDRLTTLAVSIVIYSLGIFNSNKYNNIHRKLDEIDLFLCSKLKVQIASRSSKCFAIFVFSLLILFPLILLSRRFFFENLLVHHLLVLWILSNMFVSFHQAFYIVFLFLLHVRVKAVENFIEMTPSTNVEMLKIELEAVLMKVVDLVGLVNENVGKIVVMIFSKLLSILTGK
jgi:hypothetical protein